MKRSPFPDPDRRADLDSILSVLLPADKAPVCADFRPVGLSIIADRDIHFTQFLEELKVEHENSHYAMALYIYGCKGWSADVSRQHYMNDGECLLSNQ